MASISWATHQGSIRDRDRWSGNTFQILCDRHKPKSCYSELEMIDWKQKMSLPLATSTVLSPHSLKCKFVLVVEDIQDPIKTSNSACLVQQVAAVWSDIFSIFFFCKWRVGSCETPLINACGSGQKTSPALGIISRTLNKCDHFYGWMLESAVFSLPRSFLCPSLFYFCNEYRNLFPSSHLCNLKYEKTFKTIQRLSEYSICVFQNISLVTAKMLAGPQRETIGSSWLWTCSIPVSPHPWIGWSAFAVTASVQAFYKSNLSGKIPPLV